MSMTDEQLVKAYAQGNNDAFDILLKRHQDRIFNYILRIVKNEDVANDIFQDTFMKAIMTIRLNRKELSEATIEDMIISEQINDDVHYLIDELPELQQEVLKMRYYGNLSFKEIAEATGVSINTALGRMRYALMNLRKIAEENHIVLTM